MTARTRRGSVAALLAAMLMIGMWALTYTSPVLSAPTAAQPTPSSTPTPTPTATPCSPEAVATQAVTAVGFSTQQFVIGESNFNLSLPGASSRGSENFSTTPLVSKKLLVDFLKSQRPASKAVVKAMIHWTKGTVEMVENAENWVGVQFLVPTHWSSNHAWLDGKITTIGSRYSPKGDIAWIFVNPNNCRSKGIMVLRGPCGNPQASLPTVDLSLRAVVRNG